MTLKQNALISVAELNAILQTTVTSGLDEQVINYASQIIETLCNRKFISQDYTEQIYNIESPTHYLYFKNFPVTKITGIYDFNTSTATKIMDYVKNTDYIEYLEDGYLYFHSKLCKSIGELRVSYTAGYAIADIPYDLKIVCAQVAGLVYNTKAIAGVDSERIGNYAITYSKGSVNVDGIGFPIPAELYNTIMFYRNPNI